MKGRSFQQTVSNHLLDKGHLQAVPTVRMLRHWWGVLNKGFFAGSLRTPQLDVAETWDKEGALGLFYALPGGIGRIVIHSGPVTKSCILGTLAHEMVHQYQYQYKIPLDHGAVFEGWKLILTQHGLDV